MDDAPDITLETPCLRVVVRPRVGGTIESILHRGIGASVLGTTPWDVTAEPEPGGAAPDEPAWLTRYGGGWPLLFPNAGDACTVDGVRHGFHGEASISPWRVLARTADSLRLERRFFTVPVTMTRDIALDDDVVTIRETIRMEGPAPIGVMWGHHPTFGSDLLAGDVAIETGATLLRADDSYDPPANPLVPGGTGRWPTLPAKRGTADLSRPAAPAASLACLAGFTAPWASIRRRDGHVGALLTWDGDTFPVAWLWCELSGTSEAPWYGRGRLIGIEPNSTWPAAGLARARAEEAPLFTLRPNTMHDTWIRLHVFRPHGPVRGADSAGRATFGADATFTTI